MRPLLAVAIAGAILAGCASAPVAGMTDREAAAIVAVVAAGERKEQR